MIESIIILSLGYVIIAFINKYARYDKISKWFIITFQTIWGVVLFTTCFRPNDLYLPSVETYCLLLLNVIFFTLGFVVIKVKDQWRDFIKDTELYISATKILKNKYFICYLIIITLYALSLLKKYIAKIATVESLGQLRYDFFYDNFYGDWFNYINLLFLNPTQIVLLGLTVYGLFKYRKPILLLLLTFILVYSTLAGGRLDYATIFISFFFFSTCLTKLNVKRILVISIVTIVVAGTFSFITNMRGVGKGDNLSERIENGVDDLKKHMVSYTCGAVVAFDYAVTNDYIDKMGGFQLGGLTFSSVISLTNMLTRRLGFPIKEPLVKLGYYKQETAISIGPYTTHNALYTAMLFPYLDFGVFGVTMVPFLLGVFVRVVIKRFYKYHSFPLLILLNQCYILVVFSIIDFRGINLFSTVGVMLFLFVYGSNKHNKKKCLQISWH